MQSIFFKLGALTLVSGLAMPAFADSNDDLLQTDSESTVQDEVIQFQASFGDDTNNSDDERGRVRGKVKEICAKVNATEEQKSAIMEAVFAYKEKAIPLEATAKLAKVKYIHNALATSGDAVSATSVAADGIAAVTQLLQAKEAVATKILFDILKQDQRKDGLKCMLAIKKLKKARRNRD